MPQSTTQPYECPKCSEKFDITFQDQNFGQLTPARCPKCGTATKIDDPGYAPNKPPGESAKPEPNPAPPAVDGENVKE